MIDKRRYRISPLAKSTKFIRKLTLAKYRLNWRLHQQDSRTLTITYRYGVAGICQRDGR